MNKIRTFYRYLKDFIKHGEYSMIFSAFLYFIFKVPALRTRLVKSSLGYFLSRKGTIDFQFANYAYEWNVKRFFMENINDCNVFIDVGANIGTYCIMMAKNGLKCIGVEPVEDNYKAMRINILLNDLEDKIMHFNCALGKDHYFTDFVFNSVNTGASHLYHPPEKCKFKRKVVVKKMDELYPGMGLDKTDRILMKVDVEGMETEVFEGAKNFIKTFPNMLIVFESKHSDIEHIKKIFDNIADFDYTRVDHFNMALKKIKS